MQVTKAVVVRETESSTGHRHGASEVHGAILTPYYNIRPRLSNYSLTISPFVHAVLISWGRSAPLWTECVRAPVPEDATHHPSWYTSASGAPTEPLVPVHTREAKTRLFDFDFLMFWFPPKHFTTEVLVTSSKWFGRHTAKTPHSRVKNVPPEIQTSGAVKEIIPVKSLQTSECLSIQTTCLSVPQRVKR